MKSFIFWIIGLATGAIFGYLSTYLFEIIPAVAVSCGIILGSTIAITLNILRVDDVEDEDDSVTETSDLNQ